MAGIERIAAATAERRCCRLLLHDRCGGCDLRLLISRLHLRIALLSLRIARLCLGLPGGRIGLSRGRRRGHAGLSHRGLAGGGCGRIATELAQAVLELAVAVLQFLVLAGQLPELVFQPLDPHLQIGIIGLRKGRRG